MNDDLEAARAVKADLETKLAAARRRKAEAEDSIRAVAYDANTGDDAARKKQAKLTVDVGQFGAEIISLEAAVAEAERRVGAAERVIAGVAARANAVDVRKRADRLRGHGARLDAILAELLATYETFRAELLAAKGLSGAGPTEMIAQSATSRAISAALMNSKLSERFLAPFERHTLTELAAGWAGMVDRAAQAIEQAAEPSKAEAA